MVRESAKQEGATTPMDSNMEVSWNESDAPAPTLAAKDDADVHGRIKLPPICVDMTLKKEAMSTETLRQWVFPMDADLPVCTTTTRVASSNWSRSSVASNGTGTTATPLPTMVTTTTPDPHILSSSTTTAIRVPVSVVSVTSNNGYSDSQALPFDGTIEEIKAATSTHFSSSSMQPPSLEKCVSEQLNAKVALRKTSRQGRLSQRWVSAAAAIGNNSTTTTQSPSVCETNSVASAYPHEPMMRLVTGCVPILRSGKILFVSASRKPAWILPKGGWEQDETMEESAVRECFEEAGCLGTLGPALSTVQHETRKAKKRRLEHEQLLLDQSKSNMYGNIPHAVVAAPDEPPKAAGPTNPVVANYKDVIGATKNEGGKIDSTGCPVDETAASTSASASAPVVLSAEAMARIRQYSLTRAHQTDETMSVGSTLSTTYSYVQMTLFPLYVRKIDDDWPESGRFRKAVDIDEAIEMLENRPELQAALQEVNERGLHLEPEALFASTANSVPATEFSD